MVKQSASTTLSLAACLTLAPGAPAQAPSGSPGVVPGWELSLIDEFSGSTLSGAWERVTDLPYESSNVVSARIPENAVVEDGLLRLLTKAEFYQHPTRDQTYDWTSGYVRSRFFAQRYGYWEANMRIADATGLNNAFWATTNIPAPDPIFEFDIAEVHYPSNPHFNWHAWRWPEPGTKRAYGNMIPDLGPDLSASFNNYAMLWTEANEIIYYLNGVEHHRIAPNANEPELGGPDNPADVKFSTAVSTFGGPIVPELDGTSMDIDWVRVFRITSRLLASESFELSAPFSSGDGWAAPWTTPAGAAAGVRSASLSSAVAGYRNGSGGSLDLGTIGGSIERQITAENKFNYNTDASWFISLLVNRAPGAGMKLELIAGSNVRGSIEIAPDGTLSTGLVGVVQSEIVVPSDETTLIVAMIKARPGWQNITVNSGTSIVNDEMYTNLYFPGDSLPLSAPLLNEWDALAKGGSSQQPPTLRLAPAGTGSVVVDELRLGNTFASVTGNSFAGICPGDADRNGATDSLDVMLFLDALSHHELWSDYSGNSTIDFEDALEFLEWLVRCD